MEDPRELLVKIAKILDELKIQYLVSGGLAVFIWGKPRFTADIDIVIELNSQQADKLEKMLKEISPVCYVDKEAMGQALSSKGEFSFIDGDTGMKIDFWILKEDSFDQARLARRVFKEILKKKVAFTSPEDLILIKLLWYRQSPASRQLEDAASVLKVSGQKLDREYLRHWAQKLKVSEILADLMRDINRET